MAMLPFTMSIDDPTGQFAGIPNLQSSANMAASILSNVVPVPTGNSSHVLVKVVPPPTPISKPGPLPIKPIMPIYFPRFGWRESEVASGVRNAQTTTLEIQADPSFLRNDAWVSPNPAVPKDKSDFVSWAMRAVLQGMVYYGLSDSSSLDYPTEPGRSEIMGSPFDKYVVPPSDGYSTPTFRGPRTMEVNGGPVPVIYSGDELPAVYDGTDPVPVYAYYNTLPLNLLNSTIPTGVRRTPNNVDAAIIQDIGLKAISLNTDHARQAPTADAFHVKIIRGGPIVFNSLHIYTVDGTAQAGRDYQALDQSFNAEDTDPATFDFTIPIIPHTGPQPRRTFTVVVENSGIVKDQITLTIGSTAGDFNGDGATDLGVYQPGVSGFYVHQSNGQNMPFTFGQGRYFGGDPVPIVGDFDGDGKADSGVYQPNTSSYFLHESSAGNVAITFGQGRYFGGDPVPVVGDFDGDGKDDVGVYQPNTSSFFLHESSAGNRAFTFGQGRYFGGDPIPVVGDFDGDGKADPGVFQPDTSSFFLMRSKAGNVAYTFGQGRYFGGNPFPVVGDFDGDGKDDTGVFQPDTSSFFVHQTSAGNRGFTFGQGRVFGGDPIPVVGDFDGDGRIDLGVYQPGTSTYFLQLSGQLNDFFSFGQGRIYGGDPVPLIPTPGVLAMIPGYRVTRRQR